jgi:hypothetical protein
MARAGDLAHNDAYFTEATRERLHARLLGENVARNGDVDAAHRALMASPPHRANILDGRFTIVGIGAELREGSWWLTEDFLQPASAVPAPDRPRGTAATSAPPAVPTTARLPVAAPTTPAQDAGEVLGAVASGPTDEWRAPHPAAARRGIAALPGESVLDPRVIAALLAVGVVGVVSMSALRRSDPRRDPAVSARGAKRSRGTNPTRGDARGPGGRRLSAMLASWPERPASSGGPARWRG